MRGRGKGSDFERTICRRLSVWWTNDSDTDVLFWRTSQSGGRVTSRKKKGKASTRAHCGDICALDHRGAALTNLITWELKNGYRDASLHQLVDAPANAAQQTYVGWVEQAESAALEAGTPYWAIVHHKSFREDVLTIPAGLWKFLGCNTDIVLGPVLMVQAYGFHLVSMQFDQFLKGVTPKEIRRFASHVPRIA